MKRHYHLVAALFITSTFLITKACTVNGNLEIFKTFRDLKKIEYDKL